MNSRLECSSRNKSLSSFFALSVFGGSCRRGMSFLVTWSAAVKAVINCALCWHLHWVIYGSLIEVKRETCWRSGGRLGLCGSASERPTGLGGERGWVREGSGEERQGILLSSLSVSCFLFSGERETHSSEVGSERGEDNHEKSASHPSQSHRSYFTLKPPPKKLHLNT